MDAPQIAGRFAAYAWYMEVRTPQAKPGMGAAVTVKMSTARGSYR